MQSLRSKQHLGLASPGQVLRILLVEDEVIFARAVVKRLQQAGYECIHVQTVRDGRALASQYMPDLVILDMSLPDGHGITLLPLFTSAGVAVIVVSASEGLVNAEHFIKLGANAFLEKPLDLQRLLHAIEHALIDHPGQAKPVDMRLP